MEKIKKLIGTTFLVGAIFVAGCSDSGSEQQLKDAKASCAPNPVVSVSQDGSGIDVECKVANKVQQTSLSPYEDYKRATERLEESLTK